MTQEEKINELAEMFEVEPAELMPERSLDTLNWDSMSMLSLIALVKARFDKRLTGETLRGFKTIGDMLAVMEV